MTDDQNSQPKSACICRSETRGIGEQQIESRTAYADRDLPALLKDALSRQAENYTVPLILDSEFIGSGTLIRFDNATGY